MIKVNNISKDTLKPPNPFRGALDECQNNCRKFAMTIASKPNKVEPNSRTTSPGSFCTADASKKRASVTRVQFKKKKQSENQSNKRT